MTYVNVLQRHSSGETEENHENPQYRKTVTRMRFEPGSSRIIVFTNLIGAPEVF